MTDPSITRELRHQSQRFDETVARPLTLPEGGGLPPLESVFTKLGGRIIGLCGYAGSGKDTIADYMEEEFTNTELVKGGKVYRRAFAQAIRNLANEVNHFIPQEPRVVGEDGVLLGRRYNELLWDMTYEGAKRDTSTGLRKYLVLIGEGFRKIDHLFWVKTVFALSPMGVEDIPQQKFEAMYRTLRDQGYINGIVVGENEPSPLIDDRAFTFFYKSVYEVIRRLDPITLRTINELGSGVDRSLILITDVRNSNEAVTINMLGGEVWKINRFFRADSDGNQMLPLQPSSETERTTVDAVHYDEEIDNDGTVEDLHKKVEYLLFVQGIYNLPSSENLPSLVWSPS